MYGDIPVDIEIGELDSNAGLYVRVLTRTEPHVEMLFNFIGYAVSDRRSRLFLDI